MLLAPLAVLKKGLTSTQHQHAATTLLQHWSRQFLVTSNNNRRAASSTNRVANQFAEVSKQSSFASSHQQHQQQEQTTAAVVLGTAACACPHHHLHHQQQQQPQHMTTSHKQQRKQLQHPSLSVPSATAAAARSSKSSSSRSRDSGSGKAALNSSTVSEPSSSSNGSDLCTLLDNTRPTSRALSPAAVSTKSAKRKAAEALLAAQYGGLGGGGSSSGAFAAAGTTTAAAAGRAGASASGMHAARFMSDVSALPPASSPAMLSNKKRKSMLSTAINRLGGAAAATAPVSVVEGSPEASATVAAAAAAATTTQTSYAAAQALPDVVVPAAETLLQQQQQQQQPDQTRSSSQHDVATSRQPTHVHFDESGAAITAADADASAAAAGGHSHAHSPAVVPVEAAGAAAQQQHGSSSARAAQPPLQQQQQQQSVVVPACADDCAHTYSQGWCHSQVQLPHLDWGRVLDADMAQAPTFKLAQGYERLHMPGGIQVLVVENHVHLPAALSQLRCSMQDPLVAIDLEWRPQFGKGFTPVAMVQLASSRVAVLIRTCHMGYRLPPALRDFLKDPQVHLLGFSWAGQDESKMQSTFGVGSKDFGRFLDLQQVAQGLGYHGFGLARLTQQVLGLPMPKSKKISMSNWECNTLSRGQVKYAALDVLVAGQVFRALRLWHSSPSLCEVCHSNLGVPTNQQMFVCAECDKPFWSIRGYTEHCERNSHKLEWAECEGCGCARQLPFASSKSAAAATAAGLEDEAEADEQ